MKNRYYAKMGMARLEMATALLLSLAIPSLAAFNSGSTGADGALNITATGVTIWDPHASGLDPDGDNVFHFTTINIASGVTLKLRANVLGSRPVVWLATGNVTISGPIDLNGDQGHAYNAAHQASVAGAGGFSGGIGVQPGVLTATAGEGPGKGGVGGGNGGGAGSPCGYGASAGHRLAATTFTCTGSCCAVAGGTYDNQFILPLQGGSGGAGMSYNFGSSGPGGGAGGGAILIASSGTITLNGSITALGGSAGAYGFSSTFAGAGSGGSVRMVANAIGGSGSIQVQGGGSSSSNAGAGFIRLESYSNTFSISSMSPMGIFATPGLPLFPPAGSLPAVRIKTIDGVNVPANPNGTYTVPDVTVNKGDSCDVAIEANNIPTGTVVSLTLTSEEQGTLTLSATPLAGTLSQSTATARTKIPPGYSRFSLSANW